MDQSNYNTSKLTFFHLNAFDRGKIQAFHNEGKALQAIAEALGCDKSMVSREIKRGTVS